MLALCVAIAPIHANAAPPGSKNFTSPAYVPNYFSSEAGSFQGNATARARQTGAGPVFAVPAPRRTFAAASRRIGRHHAVRAAQARRYVRLARIRAGAHRQFVDARAFHNRIVHAGVAPPRFVRTGVTDARAARAAKTAGPTATPAQHGPPTSKAVAAKTRPPPSKGKPLAPARG
jgi:hypothetical protein